jgi:hypothetical protein
VRTRFLLDVLGWIEVAVFALAAVSTAVYVIVRVLVTAVRCGSVWRGLGLAAAALAFLLGWAAFIFTGVVVTMMAVVSDVQASPRGEEVWRHLTVLGVAAVLTLVAGLVAAWATRRICAAVTR